MVGQLLLNVETIESETDERFKNLANAFEDLKITLTEVKYRNTTQRTKLIHHCFIFLMEKQFPYGTKLPLGSAF